MFESRDPEVTKLIDLLCENTARMEAMCKEITQLMRGLKDGPNLFEWAKAKELWDLARSRFYAFKAPAQKLARAASQQIEHSNLPTIPRIELEVRVAELEASIRASEDAVQTVGQFCQRR